MGEDTASGTRFGPGLDPGERERLNVRRLELMAHFGIAEEPQIDWWLWRMPSERLRLRGAAIVGPNAPIWERRKWERAGALSPTVTT